MNAGLHDVRKAFGGRMRRLREDFGRQLQQVAGDLGKTPSQVSEMETGKRPFTHEAFRLYLRFCPTVDEAQGLLADFRNTRADVDLLDAELGSLWFELFKENVKISNIMNKQGITAEQFHTGRGYTLDCYEVTYKFPDRQGDPVETLELREVRALHDGLKEWKATSTYWEDKPDLNPDVTLFGPGLFEIVKEAKLSTVKPGRTVVQRVEFPRALNTGETVRFVLCKRYRGDFATLTADGHRSQRHMIPAVPTRSLTVNVQFPRDLALPKAIWYFEAVPQYMMPGVFTDTNSLIGSVDRFNRVTRTWDEPSPEVGMAYGIAWRW